MQFIEKKDGLCLGRLTTPNRTLYVYLQEDPLCRAPLKTAHRGVMYRPFGRTFKEIPISPVQLKNVVADWQKRFLVKDSDNA